MTDWGYALPAAVAILLFYYFYHRKIALGADWFLLIIFVLMFITLKLLAELAVMRQLTYHLLALPGELFTAAVLNSQVMSNVPAAIYLNAFTEDWRMLAWGVSVGGFGLAIGSMANLIALRLAKQPGLWKEFHYWSIPLLIVGFVVAVFLDWLLNQAV